MIGGKMLYSCRTPSFRIVVSPGATMWVGNKATEDRQRGRMLEREWAGSDSFVEQRWCIQCEHHQKNCTPDFGVATRKNLRSTKLVCVDISFSKVFLARSVGSGMGCVTPFKNLV
jgi:hypothetical protein